MSIEDYLKYRDDVVLEKARLYKNETQPLQIITKNWQLWYRFKYNCKMKK